VPVTRRSEYGLRAMGLLGEQLPGERLSARDIARREQIPPKYLEQILAALKQAGLVESRAGARGGYSLSRPARDITIGEIVAALDGSVDPAPGGTPARPGDPAARLWPLWRRLARSMRQVLDGTTLDQLTFTTAPPEAPQPDDADPQTADADADAASPDTEQQDAEPAPDRRLMYWI